MRLYTALFITGAGSKEDEDLTFGGVYASLAAAQASLEAVDEWEEALEEGALEWKSEGSGSYAQTEDGSPMFLVFSSLLEEASGEQVHI